MANQAPAPKPNAYGPAEVPRAATWRQARYLEDLTPEELEQLYGWLRDFDYGPVPPRFPVLEALTATVYRELARRPAAVR